MEDKTISLVFIYHEVQDLIYNNTCMCHTRS